MSNVGMYVCMYVCNCSCLMSIPSSPNHLCFRLISFAGKTICRRFLSLLPALQLQQQQHVFSVQHWHAPAFGFLFDNTSLHIYVCMYMYIHMCMTTMYRFFIRLQPFHFFTNCRSNIFFFRLLSGLRALCPLPSVFCLSPYTRSLWLPREGVKRFLIWVFIIFTRVSDACPYPIARQLLQLALLSIATFKGVSKYSKGC